VPIVSCRLGEQERGPDATGSAPYENVAEPSIDAAFTHWLQVDGRVVAFLPLQNWTKASGDDGWARFDYVVNGSPKASVLFAAVPEGSATRWSWNAAACDPAEFAPTVRITGGVVVWSDASGRRVPTSKVLERNICGNPNGPTTLTLAGVGVFTRDPGDRFEGRLLVPFATDIAVPSDATTTEYQEGGHQLWIAHDRKAAYVGSRESADRWPRVKNDDASVVDCN
jgi:hypothetical protein